MVYTIRVYKLEMEARDCPPLNMNAMRNISVKTVLKSVSEVEFITKWRDNFAFEQRT